MEPSVELIEASRRVFEGINHLIESENFEKFRTFVTERVPELKSKIESKDAEISRLNKELEHCKAQSDSDVRRIVRQTQAQLEELEKKHELLGKDCENFRKTIENNIKIQNEAEKIHENLRKQLENSQVQTREHKTKLSAASQEMIRLEMVIKNKDIIIEELNKGIESANIKVTKVLSDFDSLKNIKSDLEKRNKSLENSLNDIKGFAVPLSKNLEDSQWILPLEKTWRAARELVESHFKSDLSPAILQNPNSWKGFSHEWLQKLPLPRSNSRAAKQMRVVALLAVLARNINDFIFHPVYTGSGTNADKYLRHCLEVLAQESPEKESHLRAVLLSVEVKDEKKVSERILQVVKKVVSCVDNLIPESQQEAFRSELHKIVQQAHNAWALIQTSEERFEPSFPTNHQHNTDFVYLGNVTSNMEGGILDIYDQVHRSPGSVKFVKFREEALVIFPQIDLILQNKRHTVMYGVAIGISNVQDAMAELQKMRNSDSNHVLPATRTRRRSCDNSFLEHTASSKK